MTDRHLQALQDFDRQDLMERLDEDLELAGELVELFAADVENRRCAIRSAIDRNDGAGLEKEAHALKGAAANLSLPLVRELASRLEAAGGEENFQTAEGLYRKLLPAIDRAVLTLKAEFPAA